MTLTKRQLAVIEEDIHEKEAVVNENSAHHREIETLYHLARITGTIEDYLIACKLHHITLPLADRMHVWNEINQWA